MTIAARSDASEPTTDSVVRRTRLPSSEPAGPISPELVLVDPELQATARAALPDLGEVGGQPKRGGRVGAAPSDDAVHQLRIRVKRMRYTLELAATDRNRRANRMIRAFPRVWRRLRKASRQLS